MCIVFFTLIMGICTKTVLAHHRGLSERVIRGIPIHPFDSATIRHLTRRPTPFNYDAELVHVPHNAKPNLQIMERISVPVDTNLGYAHKHNNKPKSMEYNQHNFDAYMIPPYQLTTITPETHQLARTPNQTESFRYVIEPVLKYPSRNVAKQLKQTNAVNRFNRMPIEFDKQDFYRSLVKYEEQRSAIGRQRVAQPALVKHPVKYYRNNKAPVGIEYFHSQQQHKPYPPVAYAPTYAEHYNSGQRFEDVEPANSQVYQRLEMLQNEELPPLTTTAAAPTFAPTMIPTSISERESSIDLIQPRNVSKKETKTNRTADKLKSYPDLITTPEMFRFTINYAIIRPQGKQAMRSYDGPVTLTPPSISLPLKPRQQQHHHNHNEDKPAIDTPNEMNSMQSTQTIRRIPIRARDQSMHQHNAKFSGQHQTQHQMYRQPQPHITPSESINNDYRWLNELQYQQIPFGVSSSSSSSRRQVHRPSSNEPIIMSTQMTVTSEKSDAVEPQLINELTTMDSKRMEKRLRRRRPNDERRTDSSRNGSIITVTPMAPLLEFSNSYTNRRTQGYNSAEEIFTTPIPVKLKNARSQLNESDHSTSANSEKRQNRRHRVSTTTATTTTSDVNEPNRSEDARYFQ